MNDTNRVIKFRAWDQDEKQMIPDGNGWLIEIDGSDTRLVQWDSTISVHRPILMQFTGLKDKNGKEIYEGDIVKEEGINFSNLAVVIWKNSGFEVDVFKTDDDIEHSCLNDVVEGDCEVIGNIYENTELSPTPDEGKDE